MARVKHKRMGVSNSDVKGTNANHWVNPYGRDITRGASPTDFPTMHSDDVGKHSMTVRGCDVCGISMFVPLGTTESVCAMNDAGHRYYIEMYWNKPEDEKKGGK